MKLFFLPFFISMLFFVSCSQDNTITSEGILDFEIQKRTDFDCIQDASCEINYDFPIKGPGAYNQFIVTFDASMTLGEVFCLEQAYFKCFGALRRTIMQPSDPYKASWCYPIGKPSITISTTIDTDPRVDDGD